MDVDAIRRTVLEAQAAYYGGEAVMSDAEYDELVLLLAGHGVEVVESHAPKPGWAVKTHHLRPMGSMSCQPRSPEEIVQKFPGLVDVSMKYDGLAMELVYVDGRLIRAVLRGTGVEGEDVYQNARYAQNVLMELDPHTQSFDGTTVGVYGELVISWNNLNALNEFRVADGLEPYKTPRNAVSMVRSKPTVMSSHRMCLMAFKAYDLHPGLERQGKVADELRRWGYDKLATHRTAPSSDVWPMLLKLEERIAAFEMQYQIDGLVVRSNSDFQNVAKVKLRPTAALTTVIEVLDSLGRTGVVAPVVVVEPVELGGVTVRRATGHNQELMLERLAGIGPGATVMVSRRGDVIPHVERVVNPSSTPWVPPTVCPSCGSKLTAQGVYLKCSADPSECSGTSVGLILKYVKSMGVDGIGPSVAGALVRSGLATEPAHLYGLSVEVLAQLPMDEGRTLGEALAERLVNSLWENSRTTLGKLLGSIGVDGCAQSVMDAVAGSFPGSSVLEASTADLAEVPGVGPTRASAIHRFMATRGHVFTDLLRVIEVVEPASGGPLAGMTFCITLGLTEPREQIEAKIRQAGGDVKSSVTRQVTHLVCNYPDEDTTKLKTAKERKIPILSELELTTMMGSHSEGDGTIDEVDPF